MTTASCCHEVRKQSGLYDVVDELVVGEQVDGAVGEYPANVRHPKPERPTFTVGRQLREEPVVEAAALSYACAGAFHTETRRDDDTDAQGEQFMCAGCDFRRRRQRDAVGIARPSFRIIDFTGHVMPVQVGAVNSGNQHLETCIAEML